MANTCKFKHLGAMFDCTRNAVITVPQLKKFMDLLKKMGYNRIYIYMEDTYEIEGEPYFGYLRGRYSQEELMEIDDYAYSLGMEFVPVIQTLAFMDKIFQWPQYAALRDIDDILLVDDERTYALIDKMLSSLRKCLRHSNLIHLSMDEAANLGKGRYRDIHGETPSTEIMMRHLNRVCDMAKGYGLEPIIWSSTLYHSVNGTWRACEMPNYPEGEKFDETLVDRIPKGLYVNYDSYNEHREDVSPIRVGGMLDWFIRLVGKEHVHFAAGAWKWQAFSPRNQLSMIATGIAMKECAKRGIDTFFQTMWGDDGAEASPYCVLPTLAYTACLAHGIEDMDEIRAKFREWVGADMDDFMLLDQLDYTPEYMIGMPMTPTKAALYSDCFLGKLETIIAPYDAANYAKFAENIGEAAERVGEYKYVFETLSKLCSVLALKAAIGKRTREVYQSGDKAALDALIVDYDEMIRRTEVFYTAFRTQWYTENKPHGFEVQDIRVGGLICRMRNCRDRLQDYRDGKVDRLIDLEDELLHFVQSDKLPYSGVKVEGMVSRYPTWWNNSVTTSKL